MGSVLRLAANIGALKTVFISETAHGFKAYKIKRTASGAFDKTDWKIISLEVLKSEIPDDYRLIAIETSPSAQNIYSFTFPEKTALCIGNEKNGIRPEILDITKQHVYIPLPGPVTSLNTTHALAITLFEWHRQMSVKIS
jgi:tRNA G18 (ribose-2'-O)-methylase SpoU